MKKTSPYGSWRSPITAEKMAAKSIGFSFPRFFEQILYWMEFRPTDSARTVIVQRSAEGNIQALTPEGYSVQTRAQEYGGCCYTVGDGYLFFVNSKDQRIYRQQLDQVEVVEPFSPSQNKKGLEYRYADLVFDTARNRIIAVAEAHSDGDQEPQALLVSISMTTRELEVLAKGADFYAHPRLSSSGQHILWIEWNHPNMPWDATELWHTNFDNQGKLAKPTRIGSESEAIFQPEWSSDNKIYFVSDRNEWWNLYRHEPGGAVAIFPTDLECGLPLWQFGMTTWGFVDDSKVILSGCEGAEWRLVIFDITTGQRARVTSDDSAYNHFNNLATDSASGQAAVIASGPTVQSSLCSIKNGQIHTLASSGDFGLSEADISTPTALCFPTTEDDQAFGYYYQPTNQSYKTAEDEKPPLIVLCHGGPTASTTAAFNLKVQFWTSRGFAVIDVNYRGSTGYGRSYREKLKGNWGVYDIDDACAAAEHAVKKGWADPERLIIRGSSAGGFTVLGALCFRKIFSAGCSLYGIGDLNTLANDTHKFESRYTDCLIGPAENSELYAARSPICHINGFDCPTIFFQGLKDKVVPPDQAESMVTALNEKSVPVAHITYAEESHGFRQTENIIHAFNAELAFYGRVFGFPTDSVVADLDILNLDKV